MEFDQQTPRECSRCGAVIPDNALGGCCLRCGGDPAAAVSPDEAGISKSSPDDTYTKSPFQKIPDIGDYEIIEMIGRGGMGVVYKARQRSLNRIVALKTLLGGVHSDDDHKKRFWREAHLAAQLQHSNIVPVFDVGEQDGQPYFSMEYVPGTDLARMTLRQPLRPEEAARYVEAVARAVHYAHEQGILHRDLKPSNILVTTDNRPLITDFGLARLLDAESSLTSPGALLGSPGYLPPEQLSAGSGEVGPASDVYGLGATLYHLLTGRPPYLSSTINDTLKQLLETEPVPPRQLNRAIPQDLELICLKCLKKKQAQRYRSALELAADLQRYLDNQPVEARFSGLANPDVQWGDEPDKVESQNSTRLAVLITLLAMIAVLAWWQNWGRVRERAWSHLQHKEEVTLPSPSPETNATVAQPAADTKTPEIAKVTPSPLGNIPGTTQTNGWLRVRLLKNSVYHSWNTPVFCEIQGNTTHLSAYLAEDKCESPLPAGSYTVTLYHSPRDRTWPLVGTPVKIHENETNSLDFTFMYSALKLQSDPPGATMTWPPWATVDREITSHSTPFTNRFRSGAIPFTASLRCYSNALRTNFFYPSSDTESGRLFTVKLNPKPVPLAGKPWTNSLGMVFRWLEPQRLWACEVETRVRDYRVFAQATHYDLTNGMFSVTGRGLKQIGYSWDNPGPAFSQDEDCPVIGVNWMDATNFCDWLTRHEYKLGHLETEQRYRLPTMNEWIELANGRRFPWGDEARPIGNYAGAEVLSSDWPACWPVLTDHVDKFARTAPVYSPEFKPNELGFYHLGGNAAEWCQDMILCGGSWFDGETDDFNHLQTLPPASPVEVPVNPRERHDRNGFRVFLEDFPSTRASVGLTP